MISNAIAPLKQVELAQLRQDAQDVRAAAKRKGHTMDAWEEQEESEAAQEYFELGTWLFYYSKRIYKQDGLSDRIDCARRIFETGMLNPGYKFYSAFDFGERQFDTIFEMGDSSDVIDGLREIALKEGNQNLIAAFKQMGWSMDRRQMALF